ncbi:hypothetical protein F4X33_10490 [Candidatus Poribacteria bacterium]|nr:hypothetical protein [Candidatus Poribacteria bacterium]
MSGRSHAANLRLAKQALEVCAALDDGELLPLGVLHAVELRADSVGGNEVACAVLGSPVHLGDPDQPDPEGIAQVVAFLRQIADGLDAMNLEAG